MRGGATIIVSSVILRFSGKSPGFGERARARCNVHSGEAPVSAAGINIGRFDDVAPKNRNFPCKFDDLAQQNAIFHIQMPGPCPVLAAYRPKAGPEISEQGPAYISV